MTTSSRFSNRALAGSGAGPARPLEPARRRVSRLVPIAGVLALSLVASRPAVADVPSAMSAIAAGDCKTAGDEINQGLSRSDPQAYFLAGYLYDQTGCVNSDPAHAARLYRRAVALGDRDAAIYLGLLYGLGRGVPQDYALAHLAFSGNPATVLDASANTPAAIEAGYVETIAHLAKSHVDYPTTANLKGIEATIDVVVDMPAGTLEFEHVRVDTEIGTSLPRTHDFTDQIAKAYGDAIAAAPKPPIADGAVRRYVTQWTFAMRRGPSDEKVPREGFVSVGETKPLA